MPRPTDAAAGSHASEASRALSGPGHEIDPGRRASIEHRTGQDLADVRLHTGARVRVAARAAGASAFTLGRDIGVAVGPGEPVPDRLLAHELIHAAQQGRFGQASSTQAEQQAEAAVSGAGPVAGGVLGTGGSYVAYARSDWLESTPDLRRYGYSELLDELTEVNEWLDRQTASSPEADRMEEARAALTAELSRRRGAMQAPDRPRPRRRKRGQVAAPDELPPQTEMPRVLAERTSTPLTDPAEIRTEVDRITAWLQRPDLTRDDRAILRTTLSTLAPSLVAGLAQSSAERRQARLAQALAPSGTGDRAGVIASLRMIESIQPYREQPGMAYVIHDGELLVFPQELADRVRAETVAALGEAARRAREMNESSKFLMSEHMRLNYEDQPYVGFVVSVFSGEEPVELQTRMLDPLSDSNIALSRFQSAQERQSLTAMGDAVFTAIAKADEARVIVDRGIDRAIATAGSVVQGLTITRNLAFAVSLSIGAILAAPVVAAGVAGFGATGLTATGLTALGTSGIVGTGGFGLGFLGGAGGELAAGRGVERALGTGWSEGVRVGGQGAAIGLGGGATLGLARNLGLGAEGLSLGQNLWRGALAQGTGSGLGGAAGGLFAPPQGMGRGEAALRGGLTGFGLGVFGGTAGAYARTLGSPVAQYAVGVGAPSVAAGGVTYLQTGDLGAAIQSGGLALTTGTLGQMRAAQGRTAGEERAFALGQSARQGWTSMGNTGRAYAAAAGLGLFSSSSAFRMGQSGGSYNLSSPAAGGSSVVPQAAVQPAPVVPQAAVQPAPVVPQAAVQPAPVVPQAAVQPAPVVPQAAVQPAPVVPQAAVQPAPVVPPAAVQPAPVVPQAAVQENDWTGVVTPSLPSRPLTTAAIAAQEASSFSSVPVILGSHASSPGVRAEAGVTGRQFESAHIVAQTIGAAINRVRPGTYSPGRALAEIIPPNVHRAFDQGWVSRWNQAVRSGQRMTVNDARNLLRDALDGVPANLMTQAEKGALMLALDHQLFQTLGLSPDLVLFGGP